MFNLLELQLPCVDVGDRVVSLGASTAHTTLQLLPVMAVQTTVTDRDTNKPGSIVATVTFFYQILCKINSDVGFMLLFILSWYFGVLIYTPEHLLKALIA